MRDLDPNNDGIVNYPNAVLGDQEPIANGCLPSPKDSDPRNYPLSAAIDVSTVDFNKGYDAFLDAGLSSEKQDQNGSSSCTCQASSQLIRVLWKKGTGKDITFSPRWTYCHIHLDGGGAYIRDAVHHPATVGPVPEKACPSYEDGHAPSEEFATKVPPEPIYSELLAAAKLHEKFDYRVADPQVDSIEVFAASIEKFGGLVGGFTGTNGGWCRPDCRPPLTGEKTWGHAVYLCAYGKLDVAVGDLPIGTKCIFTPNSWGNRYGIRSGRWAGYQAIPESYFTEQSGRYVFAAYALTPNGIEIDATQKISELLARYDSSVVRNTSTGQFGFVSKGDEKTPGSLKACSDSRAGLLALTAIQRKSKFKDITEADWVVLPKTEF
jgi:hypothetical protein